ncbi:MAG TPA: hypothetical protein PLM33_13870 [Acidobacteriota bacterium]|nr:hypothetical protein [Acidobacteriota bacterium]HRV09643.1 hypothetical protein [Acidobacteriota bacterium]
MMTDREALVRKVVDEVLRRLGETPQDENTACACRRCRSSREPERSAEQPSAGAADFQERVLTSGKLMERRLPPGAELFLAPRTLVTPLAWDLARERGWKLVRRSETPSPGPPGNPRRDAAVSQSSAAVRKLVAYFSQRGGLTEESIVRRGAEQRGLAVEVAAAWRPGEDPVERALECVGLVASGRAGQAVVLVEDVYRLSRRVARVAGVAARVCWDPRAARDARREGCSVLLLSGRSLAVGPLRKIVDAWFRA